jgi:hypothetical protein
LASQEIWINFHSKELSIGEEIALTVIFSHSDNHLDMSMVLPSFHHNNIIEAIIKIIQKNIPLIEFHILEKYQVVFVSV